MSDTDRDMLSDDVYATETEESSSELSESEREVIVQRKSTKNRKRLLSDTGVWPTAASYAPVCIKFYINVNRCAGAVEYYTSS